MFFKNFDDDVGRNNFLLRKVSNFYSFDISNGNNDLKGRNNSRFEKE